MINFNNKDEVALIHKHLSTEIYINYGISLGWIETIRKYIEYLETENKELTEENERLSHHCDDCAGCTQWKCDCSNIRDEAITEFAEMLKYTLCINKEGNTEFFDYACTLETIDQTAKEILEENNV